MKHFLIKSVSALEGTKSCLSQLRLSLCLRTTEMGSYLILGYRTHVCRIGCLSGQELGAAGTPGTGTGFGSSCDQLYLIRGNSCFCVSSGVFKRASTPYSKSHAEHPLGARDWAGLWGPRNGCDQFLPSRRWQPRADAPSSTEYLSRGPVTGWWELGWGWEVILWPKIRNIYLVFISISGTGLLKPSALPKW